MNVFIFWQQAFVNALAIFVFLFVVWRNLKEDYASGEIFTIIFSSLGFSSLISFIVYFLFKSQSGWVWIAISVYLLVLNYFVKKRKYKFFDFFEATVGAAFLSSAIVIAGQAFPGKSWYLLSEAVAFLLFWFLFKFLSKRYRDLSWYRSGRVGFAGLVSLGIYFLLRGGVAILGFDYLFLHQSLDIVASGIVSLICFLMLYNLSKE